VRSCVTPRGGELEQIQFLPGHVSVQTTERYLGCKQRIRGAVNDRIGMTIRVITQSLGVSATKQPAESHNGESEPSRTPTLCDRLLEQSRRPAPIVPTASLSTILAQTLCNTHRLLRGPSKRFRNVLFGTRNGKAGFWR